MVTTPQNHHPQLSLAKTWLISKPSISSLPTLVTFVLVYEHNTHSEETIWRGPTPAERLLNQYTEHDFAVLAALLLMDQSLLSISAIKAYLPHTMPWSAPSELEMVVKDKAVKTAGDNIQTTWTIS